MQNPNTILVKHLAFQNTPSHFRVQWPLVQIKGFWIIFTTSSISNGLNGLPDLRDCVDKLLQLLFTQQALAQEHAAQDVGLKSCWMDLLGFWCVWNHKGCLIANKGMRTWTPINYEKKKRGWNGAYRGGREILDFQGGDQKGHPQGLEIKCTTKSHKTLTIISILRK